MEGARGTLDSVQKVTAFISIWDQFQADLKQQDAEDKQAFLNHFNDLADGFGDKLLDEDSTADDIKEALLTDVSKNERDSILASLESDCQVDFSNAE